MRRVRGVVNVLRGIKSLIRVESKDQRLITALHGSLIPEITEPPDTRRSRVEISNARQDEVAIEIISRDISSHRAALNTYLYLIYSVIASIRETTRAHR